MSIKKIVIYGDEILRKPTRQVTKISSKVKSLVKDLKDTMYALNGVGLAAPQIGSDLRVFVIDVSEDNQPFNPIVFINPVIIKKSGAYNSYEGCLSFPDVYTHVRRYSYVKVKALDINGRTFVLEADDGTLLARAIQHEFDHLEGILFVDHCRNKFETDKELVDKKLSPTESDRLIDEPEIENELSSITEI